MVKKSLTAKEGANKMAKDFSQHLKKPTVFVSKSGLPIEEMSMNALLKKKTGKDKYETEHAVALLKLAHIRRENRVLWIASILSYLLAVIVIVFNRG